jgi:SAM-dependent methyltransferase
VRGVDLSDEAIAFARGLSDESGIPATFVQAEVVQWMTTTTELRFDLAFASYGATCWLPDLDAWAHGIRRILVSGGRFVYVEFHPIVWSIAPDLCIRGDDYFSTTPFVEPVGDYVADAGPSLGAATSMAARSRHDRDRAREGGPAHRMRPGVRVRERLSRQPIADAGTGSPLGVA